MPGALVERDGELSRIDALLAAARAGSGYALVIAGPAGIGKTSLLGAARERADLAGMRVLSGRGGELEGGFSFGVARQLFEPILAGARGAGRDALLAGAARRALGAMEDSAVPAPPTAQENSLFGVIHGLYWLAVNASGAAPLLVAIDDLHWADQASLRFVLYLADRLAGLPVALVLAWRAGEETAVGEGNWHARLEQVAAGGVVSPGALSREAVRLLLEGAFGTAGREDFAAACHGVTGGNPFLVRELIEELRADGVVPGKAAADRVAGLGPRSVARKVALRVARLGPAAGELARAAAVLGDGATLRHAAALAGVGLEEAAASADGLAAIGVLEPGTPLRFVHPIVRTAVHDDIPRAARGLRHAEAARLLAADGADADAVCAHLLACVPTGSLEAVDRLRAAAVRAAGRGLPGNAVGYLRRALAETGDAGLRAVLLHELGRAEKAAHDLAAEAHLREALQIAGDPLTRAAAAGDLAEVLVLAGRWDEAAAVVRAAQQEHGDRGGEPGESPDPAVARLQTWWARFGAFDPRLAGEFNDRLPALLDAARGQAAGSRRLAGLLAGVLAWRGEPAATVTGLLDHALGGDPLLSRVDSDPFPVGQALYAALWLEDPAQAEELTGELLALSRSQGSVNALLLAAYARTAVRARRGDLVGAETDMRTVLEVAVEHGLTVPVPETLYWGADALIERPALADVAALAETAVLAPGMARTASGAVLREVRGRLALAAGDHATAQAELQAAAGTYEELHLLGLGACWRSALALALAGEDPARAARLADSELDAARRAGSPRQAGIALRTRGMLAGGDEGLHDLRKASEVLAGSVARLEHARALVEYGAALRRRNQRAAARQPLRAGLDLARRCGAQRLGQRAAGELRAAGGRPRRSAATGLEALTPSERRVAELAASGMSNPEVAQALFVTLNTVETHLRHIYQKLSISARGQLPAALRSPALAR